MATMGKFCVSVPAASSVPLAVAGDVESLTRALSAVVTDRALRARLAAGARQAGTRLRSWDDAAALMAHTIEDVDG